MNAALPVVNASLINATAFDRSRPCAGTKQVPNQMVCQQAFSLVHQNSAVQSLVQYQYGSERTRHHEAIPIDQLLCPFFNRKRQCIQLRNLCFKTFY